MMSRFHVALSAVLAALVCGVVCALSVIAVGVGTAFVSEPGHRITVGDVSGVVLICVIAAVIGLGFGAALGVLPGVLVVALWGPVQRRWGADGGVLVATAIVGASALLEVTIVLVRFYDAAFLYSLALALACTAIAVLCMWLALRSQLRTVRRTTTVWVRGY